VIDTGAPRRGPGGEFLGYVGSCIDITNQKMLEDTLRLQAEELVRSNSDLEQFAFVASHDLKEPLRNIRSYVQLLARRYKGQLDEDAEVFMGYIVAGVERMESLISDLLAYSRAANQREIHTEATSMTAAVQWAMMNLHTAIKESEAQITMDPLPTLEVDQTRIVLILQNLIGNALKYRGAESPRIHISARQEQDAWTFSVRDNGLGIDSQYFEKIFGIFQRLHGREYPGNGIGLAVCRKILEHYGGRMWVESQKDIGSTFYFRLPAI
jgi:light-regulated signal transduction histidine kinase (bacteriophytochrome)